MRDVQGSERVPLEIVHLRQEIKRDPENEEAGQAIDERGEPFPKEIPIEEAHERK